MTILDFAVSAMGLTRIALGLAPFVAARPTSRLLGFPDSHDNPTTRLMARLFGVRDIGLGVLAFYAIKDPEIAPFLFLFNMFMDLGDLISIGIPLVKRQGIDRAAVLSGITAFGGAISWFVVFLIAR